MLLNNTRRTTASTFFLWFLTAKALTAADLCVLIVDPVDLPLPGALVTVTNLKSGVIQSGFADEKGALCFDRLREGYYSVEASLTGFINVRYSPIVLRPVSTHHLTFRLLIGDVVEGPFTPEALLSGTLERDDTLMPNYRLCLYRLEGTLVACSQTNDIAEYAFIVPLGDYWVELVAKDGTRKYSFLSLPIAGLHRNAIKVNKLMSTPPGPLRPKLRYEKSLER